MKEGVFYLHEDDWGMIEIIPAENLAHSQTIAQEAREFGEAHSDGFGWTDMYVIPEPDHHLSERQIPLVELQALMNPKFPQASQVESGYSSYREVVNTAFAFSSADNEAGAFYGNQKDGVVTRLCFIRPRSELEEDILATANILTVLGVKYHLILTDWWQEQLIKLNQLDEILEYLKNEAN